MVHCERLESGAGSCAGDGDAPECACSTSGSEATTICVCADSVVTLLAVQPLLDTMDEKRAKVGGVKPIMIE